MTQGKNILVLLVIFSSLHLLTGCGVKHLDRQALMASARIAVVSVVMPRVADSSREPNRAVLQASVNQALERVQTGLTAVHTWKVLDPGKERGKAVQSFGKVSETDLTALIPAAETRASVAASVQQELSQWKNAFLGAEGMPIIPRRAIITDADTGGRQPERAVQQVMLQEAGRLCAALNVDAVLFVDLHASITHPRENTFIVSDGRTDGMLRMAASMVIVDKTGRIILDSGWPRLDDSARTKDLLPIYRGAGKDFVKEENIDLGDPRKKVTQAFTLLTDEVVADLIAKVKAAIGK